jgi:hypothetical protein
MNAQRCPKGADISMSFGFKQRFEAMNKPVQDCAEEEIWAIIRTWLVITRIVTFIAMIAMAELLDDLMMAGLSISLWSLIIGIPIFLILSLSIIWGDRWISSFLESPNNEHGRERQLSTPGIDSGKEQVLLHPIKKRR